MIGPDAFNDLHHQTALSGIGFLSLKGCFQHEAGNADFGVALAVGIQPIAEQAERVERDLFLR